MQFRFPTISLLATTALIAIGVLAGAAPAVASTAPVKPAPVYSTIAPTADAPFTRSALWLTKHEAADLTNDMAFEYCTRHAPRNLLCKFRSTKVVENSCSKVKIHALHVWYVWFTAECDLSYVIHGRGVHRGVLYRCRYRVEKHAGMLIHDHCLVPKKPEVAGFIDWKAEGYTSRTAT